MWRCRNLTFIISWKRIKVSIISHLPFLSSLVNKYLSGLFWKFSLKNQLIAIIVWIVQIYFRCIWNIGHNSTFDLQKCPSLTTGHFSLSVPYISFKLISNIVIEERSNSISIRTEFSGPSLLIFITW